jgi:radical SAM-linked protein
LDFSVEGDARFLSHHDSLRMFQRAFARAGLPVRFSEGFNPHPRLSLPLPRPVGVASQAERLVAEFERPVEGSELVRGLRTQLPGGFTLHGAHRLTGTRSPQPDVVRYRVEVESMATEELARRALSLLEADKLMITRIIHGEAQRRTLDIRPFVADLAVREGGLEMSLRITGTGSARPAELLQLLELDPGEYQHRIRRMDVQWKSDANGPDNLYDGRTKNDPDQAPTDPQT